MTIRDAGPGDRAAILEIDPVAQTDRDRVKFIERVLESALCLVAEDGSGILGYGVLEYTFFENGFISMVYVSDSARRKGVGTSLMKELASRCETLKLFTSTNESNSGMQGLLEKLGYARSGTIENLDPGDPELVYFQELGSETA
ncbi:MAG: GNAT family N-acetyltransferase [Cellvibrionaceae bacterium]